MELGEFPPGKTTYPGNHKECNRTFFFPLVIVLPKTPNIVTSDVLRILLPNKANLTLCDDVHSRS